MRRSGSVEEEAYCATCHLVARGATGSTSAIVHLQSVLLSSKVWEPSSLRDIVIHGCWGKLD